MCVVCVEVFHTVKVVTISTPTSEDSYCRGVSCHHISWNCVCQPKLWISRSSHPRSVRRFSCHRIFFGVWIILQHKKRSCKNIEKVLDVVCSKFLVFHSS